MDEVKYPLLRSDRLVLAAVGAIQGFAIWLLVDQWPETGRGSALFVALLSFVAVQGLVFHFAWSGQERARLVSLASAVALVYALVAYWVGAQLPAVGEGTIARGDTLRAVTWINTTGITLYILGPFLQIYQRIGRFRFPYPDLFVHAWSNFHIALVGLLFLGVLWAVLMLWAALFRLIDIDFFGELFTDDLFASIVSGGAIGFGLSLGREREKLVATLRTITLSVFRALLPLTALVALMFLAAVPFTGLEPLWETNRASYILLSWVLLTVLFLNAVYQDGSEGRPFIAPLRWMVEAALVAMVVFSGLALYGLGLRVGQYGLTPNRVYGLVATVILGLHAVGYAVAVARRRGPWLNLVQHVNLALAPVVVVLGLLLHTPVLDPLNWSARNQYQRLVNGDVSPAEFDFAYLRFRLGRAGARQLDRLDGLTDHPDAAAIRQAVARAREFPSYGQLGQPPLRLEDIDLYPAGSPWPAGLEEAMQTTLPGWRQWPRGDKRNWVVLAVDLTPAPGLEYVAFSGGNGFNGFAFEQDAEGAWHHFANYNAQSAVDYDRFLRSVESSSFSPAPPDYPNLAVGEYRYGVMKRP